jgi:hypothetical protein
MTTKAQEAPKALHEFTIEELLSLVSTNKATGLQKIRFSELLAESAQEEVKKEKEDKVKGIDDYIVSQGLTVEEYLKFKKTAAGAVSQEIIFEYAQENGTKHIKYKGQKGQWASKKYITDTLTKAKALEYAKGDEGKAFVEKLYTK